MTGNESQRTALVTGGSSGIGFAIARRLIDDGYRVAIVARDAQRLAASVAQFGDAACGHAADLSVRREAEAAVAAIVARWARIDVLVNNAGLTRRVGADTPADDAEAAWDAVIDANLKSAFVTTLAVLPHLAAPDARIVNVGSIAARAGSLLPGGLAYAAAKAGVEGLTVALARELGPRGVTVNTVAPGYIADTRFFGDDGVAPDIAATIRDQTPLGRAGHPADIADAVAWLASPRAAFVTGATIAVNGGWRVG
ncbi:SDR family NAD(P)-dependent oxidoreductase [Burkholderia pseudomultivorans]|uniref:3-oxoacyl-(Acyl-carrier-protein) reductase FabG n=1 Tax=Burkholderia pseudomultivorans TaxID=1207504 RepID=A0A6P2MBY7_9BURK|nr:SDR family oxidoreductase [Burkholderia pseudomultivorans]MDR8727088.1 3-oxoacyl-(acyl-carrier-protein) reductase FabG [Burkholderia pseudomultivorans]MDR8733072.1 3-oxoacyl-(acyl-carrier-protein) reductase FabG [Burkholderia pseudomultivorans]MDR8739939.1 3-oxoacyl-(acyl-carrier-protein) reductase FabG [Burkholderia pseudomultivorans]MDR8755774.1 3-oxoacyl-(acyl-carrier-protein) reductase FabG [Burkholderia pseudomultivorans]MDR8776045.1 3-oxoacyl-(acyl-carrier-protein) reductase FabG [Bur